MPTCIRTLLSPSAVIAAWARPMKTPNLLHDKYPWKRTKRLPSFFLQLHARYPGEQSRCMSAPGLLTWRKNNDPGVLKGSWTFRRWWSQMFYMKKVFLKYAFSWAFGVRKSPAQEIIPLSNVRWKDSASGSEICQLWRYRISARDCPQFPNGLVQFLMFLAGGNCAVSLAGFVCYLFVILC